MKKVILYKIDTTQGQSGSVILGRKHKHGYRIIGIHSDGDDIGNINSGVKINADKYEWINQVIPQSDMKNQNINQNGNQNDASNDLSTYFHDFASRMQSDIWSIFSNKTTFKDKPIATWTCNDVEEWLKSLGTRFEQCIDEIVNQVGLDGDTLCDMDDSDWNELHINNILKNIIKKKINALKDQ